MDNIQKVDEKELIKVLQKEPWLYLSTEANHQVTSRIISPVNDGLKIYFYTNENSLKAKQMKANPKVAIILKYYSMEGIVKNLGAINDEKNVNLKKLYKSKYQEAFTNVDESSSDDGDFYEVQITLIKQYIVSYNEEIGAEIPIGFAMTRY